MSSIFLHDELLRVDRRERSSSDESRREIVRVLSLARERVRMV